MKKFTILVDMDDVLWNLITPWVTTINEMYGTDVSEDCITDWKIAKFFPMLTPEQVYSPLFAEGFWDKMQPVADGQWFIRQLLEDGHRVKIVTATFSDNVPVKMRRFLELYPMLSWADVTVTSDKQSIKGDIMVDDAPHNLENGDYHKILVNKPHNIHYDAVKNGTVRVSSLKEAYNEIIRWGYCLE